MLLESGKTKEGAEVGNLCLESGRPWKGLTVVTLEIGVNFDLESLQTEVSQDNPVKAMSVSVRDHCDPSHRPS